MSRIVSNQVAQSVKSRSISATIVVIGGLLCGCVGPLWVDSPYPPLEQSPPADSGPTGERDVTASAADPWQDLFPAENDGASDSRLAAGHTDPAGDTAGVPHKSDEAEQSAANRELVQKNDSVTMAEVYDELEAVRAIDPELHQQLRDDLKQTDPSIWPMMVKNIRAALAYRNEQDALPVGPAHDHIESAGDGDEDNVKASHDEELWAARQNSSEAPRNSLRNKRDAARRDLRSAGQRPPRGADSETTTELAEKDQLLDPFGDNESEGRNEVGGEDDAHLAEANDAEKNTQPEFSSNETETVAHEQESVSGTDWRVQLAVAVESLEAQLAQQEKASGEDTAYETDQALLHLLYLAAGKPNEAIDGIPGLDEDQQLFWSNLLRALRDYLDVDHAPVADRRAARALRDLRDATDNLANLSQLHVGGLAICSRVESYGRYTEISPYDFEPDQEVLLYAEIDHFGAKRTDSGDYKTEFEASYQIIDSSGQRVADYTFPKEHEVCRNRRRDYFIPFRMWFPKKIYPGEYTLQLTVEDKVGEKFGQASIDFAVRR